MNKVKLLDIHGSLDDARTVVLLNCSYLTRNYSFTGVSTSTIYAAVVLFGDGDLSGQTRYSRAKFAVEGLNSWVSLSGIEFESLGNERFQITVGKPAPMAADIADGVKLQLDYDQFFAASTRFEKNVRQDAVVVLDFKEPIVFEQVTETVFRLTQFFCFALDKIVALTKLELRPALASGELSVTDAKFVSAYYESLPRPTEKLSGIVRDPLFRLPQISNQLQQVLGGWMSHCDEAGIAVNLYFAAVSGAHRYLEGQFLSLAQAAESLHRSRSSETEMDHSSYEETVSRMVAQASDEQSDFFRSRLRYGNELSFRKRLKRLLENVPCFLRSSEERRRFVSLVVETRNSLTHHGVKGGSLNSPLELWRLIEQLKLFFQLEFLRRIRMPEDVIKQLLESNRRISEINSGAFLDT